MIVNIIWSWLTIEWINDNLCSYHLIAFMRAVNESLYISVDINTVLSWGQI